MLGYLLNSKVGAATYNLLHHKGIALQAYFSGLFLTINELTLVGVVLFGHSSFDRIFGYGLKFSSNFKHTYLGWIGKYSNS